MQAALKTVTDAENAKSQYNVAKGNAENAISERNKILNDFSFWMRKLLTVSEVAFKPNPQFMEKCNVLVLSEGYKRKSSATPSPTPVPTPTPTPTPTTTPVLTSAADTGSLPDAPALKN